MGFWVHVVRRVDINLIYSWHCPLQDVESIMLSPLDKNSYKGILILYNDCEWRELCSMKLKL